MKLGFGLENALTMPTLLIIRNPEATLWTSTAGGLAYALQINFSLIVYFLDKCFVAGASEGIKAPVNDQPQNRLLGALL